MKDQYDMTVEEYLDTVSMTEFFRLTDLEKYIQAQKLKAIQDANNKADQIALKYHTEFPIGTDKNQYKNHCKSMITGFLFQSPLITSEVYADRKIINDVFKDWNANDYVMRFCNQINMLFNL